MPKKPKPAEPDFPLVYREYDAIMRHAQEQREHAAESIRQVQEMLERARTMREKKTA